MHRYFIEVTYMGTAYAGYQMQENANTVQAEVEKALQIYFKRSISLTGSSRTDAGVHALQNFFHLDCEFTIPQEKIYNLNALLPPDIAIRSIVEVAAGAHCRFDAQSREYKYFTYSKKDPFLSGRAYYFPYTIDKALLQNAAAVVKEYRDFSSFSKRNTQVKNFNCEIIESEWQTEGDALIYYVKANRFLRGMVRGLTGTMLQVGRGKINLQQFRDIIEARDCTKADFSVPGHGLFLIKVNFPEEIWET
ncbi:MAG: tRNA pseudouridine(38-40) synthase TruA [Sphingobacteriales bacterium]|nr:tRNA pseudouridine(38-40) synthase TruA [Sphingobacteriales bacterium]OJY85782.1 MAG: tRNA pseudouridine(38-40) synthase TruA [Sphingobacteriales bacterium 44-15]